MNVGVLRSEEEAAQQCGDKAADTSVSLARWQQDEQAAAGVW